MNKRPETLGDLIKLCKSSELAKRCKTSQPCIWRWGENGLPRQEYKGLTNHWKHLASGAKKHGHIFTKDEIMALSEKAKQQNRKLK